MGNSLDDFCSDIFMLLFLSKAWTSEKKELEGVLVGLQERVCVHVCVWVWVCVCVWVWVRERERERGYLVIRTYRRRRSIHAKLTLPFNGKD